MEENKEFTSAMSAAELGLLLKRLEESNEKQARYARKQLRMSQLGAFVCVLILAVLLCAAAVLIPKVNRIFNDLETVTANVNDVSQKLADTNLKQLVEDIDHLVASSDQSVQDALTQINSIDIDTLNEAIKNLSDIIRPLARLLGK